MHRRLPWVLVFFLIALPATAPAAEEESVSVHTAWSADRARPGDSVTLELSSTDVTHGISIDGYNLAVTAEPGQSQSLTFTADRPGAIPLAGGRALQTPFGTFYAPNLTPDKIISTGMEAAVIVSG